MDAPSARDRAGERLSRRAALKGLAAMGVAATLVGRGARAQSAEPIVETSHGRLRGASRDGVHIFKGIPYGASTEGRNRFLPPQPLLPWAGIRDAAAFGPRAPQLTTGGVVIIPGPAQPQIGEDCLRLNVFTPALNATGRRPVMVWLHGGGWRAGSGDIEGANLAKFGDVVVISLNHRFTLFGHLKLDDQDERFADSGNAGVLDMVAALRWVRDNAAAFGGDPGNVTIFGQSGGASKVCALMAAPAARGLFHKGISQSSSGNLRISQQEEAAARARRVAQELGLPRATGEALQAVPLNRLLAAIAATTPTLNAYRPVLDGRTFTRHPFDPDAPPTSIGIPYIAGNAATETSQDLARNLVLDAGEVRRRLVRYWAGVDPGEVDRVIGAYRDVILDASPTDLLIAITTDYQYIRNTRRAAELQGSGGRAPAYSFVFRWHTPGEEGLPRTPHGSDVPFVFGNATSSGRMGEPASSDIAALNTTMMSTWTSFARTGDPNNPTIPRWPRFEASARSTMIFDVTSRVERDPGGQARAALDWLPFYEYSMPINFGEA